MAPRVVHLVQLAGGQGVRAGGGDLQTVPKQFRATGQGPLFGVSLRSFLEGQQAHGYRVGSVVVAVGNPWRDLVSKVMNNLLAGKRELPWALAPAGPSRTASTWHALSVLAAGFGDFTCPGDGDLVAIHDAARPFASAQLMGRLVDAAASAGGAIPGIPVSDTVVQVDESVVEYLQRKSLFAVQTPQVFPWQDCHAAHQWAASTEMVFTDDGGLLAAFGHPPTVVDGEVTNWKVTTVLDWERARDILQTNE